MQFVVCNHEAHAQQILDIFNDAILHSTALYDYKPRVFDAMLPWFEAKALHGFPVIGAVNHEGVLLGFASYGSFRAWPAYKYTVEHSVYVHPAHRGKGVGLALMLQLMAAARDQQV
ncbi:MAG TPA: GNAT family N-acetyltransferase, partial [Methylophilus sp.]|nr:GNAT family N-acetyltransferase [Methylophilus sp.]